MRYFQEQSGGSQLDRPLDFCRLRAHYAGERSYIDAVHDVYDVLISRWRSYVWRSNPSPDISEETLPDPDTMVLYENIKKLFSLNDEAYRASLPYVGLVIPEWLIEAQASKLRDTIALAGKTIGTLEYSPAAGFMIYGYPLCKFDSDWMTCRVPGRLMTLSFAPGALTATIVPTPHFWWTSSSMMYAINKTLGLEESIEAFLVEDKAAEAMAEWIDKFVEDKSLVKQF